MNSLLLFVLLLNNSRIVEVKSTNIEPTIDGYIEKNWQLADSVHEFIQCEPYENGRPSENTVVYLSQDEHNFYCAFRCWTKNYKAITQLCGDADFVALYVDPFDNRTTAYFFQVYVNGIIADGWILDDGRSIDDSWDGVWDRAVKIYDDCYVVEIRIPFKSIRFKNGLRKWGINFKRYIAVKRESIYWVQVSQIEGNLVSRYGKLEGIAPLVTGHYFELYPEAYFCYVKKSKTEAQLKPSGSLNVRWDITTQTTFSATVLPDFAQIESDPFTLNLSRYETILKERRPFFLEGKEIFRISDFGEDKAFFSPLQIFYSRRIGKPIDDEIVPILVGLKLTSKSKNWSLGGLFAYTDSLIINPRSIFSVLRAKHRIFETSDIGLLFSSAIKNKSNYNYAFSFDVNYRLGFNQFISQSAISNKNGKKGFAISSGYLGLINQLLMMSSVEFVQESFDVSDIGFAPWPGLKKIMVIGGPLKIYKQGIMKNFFIGLGGTLIHEPNNQINWSKLGYLIINPCFRNEWGLNLELSGGQYFEGDIEYFYRGVNLAVWSNNTSYYLGISGNFNYSYNYNRNYLAYQSSNWLWFEYDMRPRISPSFLANIWLEWDSSNTMAAITLMLTPRITLTFTKNMKFAIFNESVLLFPETHFDGIDVISNRLGFLFSWNFLPKSWLYVAFNDYQSQNENGKLQLQNLIGAIKVKYLLYF
jgi:hypothetical protein